MASEASYDAIIVGSGIAGSALAHALGRDGRRVLLIERDWSEPDRIVGELLQPGGVESLRKLGLVECLEDIDAVPTHGYSVYYRGAPVHLEYLEKPGTEKRYQGRSFHHGRFVMKLRAAARQCENVTALEGTVTEVVHDAGSGRAIGVKATSKESGKSQTYHAGLTVVCDGCFSKFRKTYIDRPVDVRSHFVGLVLKDAVIPSPNHGHVILGDHSPILVYQISQHDTRMLVDIQGKLPAAGNGDLRAALEKIVIGNVPDDLVPSFQRALDTDRLRSMPNSYLPPTTGQTPGLLMLGDAYNMRHPLTGGGMSVALNDVVILRALLSPSEVPDLDDDANVADHLREFQTKRKSLSVVVNVLAQCLYALFAGSDPCLRRLQGGCFHYFRRGGLCVDEPVGLLSCMLPAPFTLFYHFFAVAFYTLYIMFSEAPLYQYPALAVESVRVIYTAAVTLLPYVWYEC
ncbi:squalene epoxidase-domain-containing protein [Dipodascopsis tothii]|uniref:squalene epoxidase-domain-containing protein n=1 Tax=Dipodascopsis tothii TaxID=44089 RepID=UPI0034CF8F39